VRAVLTTRSALLQALRLRAGYGLDLIRRLEGNAVSVAEARVYPVLKELQAEGLVKSVQLAPKGRRGARARTYYHLTPAGAAVVEAERKILLALLAPPAVLLPTPRDRDRMAARIIEAEELSESAEELRLAGKT
jgi:DNA-binding PadR family transcriptional regulator